jgi:hypothetical protein
MVELAILFPLLLILISGMVEFGFLMNQYLALIDSARNAARFSSDSYYWVRDASNDNCDPNAGEVTEDFFLQTACVALQELAQEQPNISLDLDKGDDIVISAFTVIGGASPRISARHPAENGWSYAERMTGSRNQFSSITSNEVASRLQAGAPNTGLLVVEVFYHYDHLLNLPWITAFLDNPLRLHSYSFMPLVSAEPTSTPPAGGY